MLDNELHVPYKCGYVSLEWSHMHERHGIQNNQQQFVQLLVQANIKKSNRRNTGAFVGIHWWPVDSLTNGQ